MTAKGFVNEGKGMWLAAICALAAFGMLSTVLGSPAAAAAAERAGVVTITQVLDSDLGAMVVEASRPATERVASERAAGKRGRSRAAVVDLAVGF